MLYLIDGHNVLFSGPGPWGADARADVPTACAVLVGAVGNLCRKRRARAVVVFDGAGALGVAPPRDVAVRFSGAGRDADALLVEIMETRSAEGPPRGETVVTSDRAVAAAARTRRFAVLSARDFATILAPPPRAPRPGAGPGGRDRRLSPAEVENWMRVFGFRQP